MTPFLDFLDFSHDNLRGLNCEGPLTSAVMNIIPAMTTFGDTKLGRKTPKPMLKFCEVHGNGAGGV